MGKLNLSLNLLYETILKKNNQNTSKKNLYTCIIWVGNKVCVWKRYEIKIILIKDYKNNHFLIIGYVKINLYLDVLT